jgi:hypothetical protein
MPFETVEGELKVLVYRGGDGAKIRARCAKRISNRRDHWSVPHPPGRRTFYAIPSFLKYPPSD